MLDFVTSRLTAKVKAYLVLAICTACLGTMVCQWVIINGTRADLAVANQQVAEMRATMEKMRADQALQLAAAEAKRAALEREFREREYTMAEQAASIERKKNARISSLERSLGIALNGLRHRPERAPAAGGGASVSAPPETAGGCTGAELARPDAEFLIRYAARAHRLQHEYDACREGRALTEPSP
jgi:hypothetical protein